MSMFDLAAMKRELEEIDARRESLVKLIAAAQAYQAAVVAYSRGEAQPPKSLITEGLLALGGRAPVGKTVMAITEDVALERIQETGRPVQTREVIEIMEARKLPLPNKNIVNVVSARLSNSNRLEGRRGFGWWPTGRPWPDQEPEMFNKAKDDADEGAATDTEVQQEEEVLGA